MANPDQKTILINNAFEEIKNICINLQKDTDASNSELKSLLKLIARRNPNIITISHDFVFAKYGIEIVSAMTFITTPASTLTCKTTK